jgi:hypothetical protein
VISRAPRPAAAACASAAPLHQLAAHHQLAEIAISRAHGIHDDGDAADDDDDDAADAEPEDATDDAPAADEAAYDDTDFNGIYHAADDDDAEPDDDDPTTLAPDPTGAGPSVPQQPIRSSRDLRVTLRQQATPHYGAGTVHRRYWPRRASTASASASANSNSNIILNYI